MPPLVRLFYAPWSHYCVCAELQLAMKGISATVVPVAYHDKTELIAATGQDYVPALAWDGRAVAWGEIPEFLEREAPTPTLFPHGQVGAATLLERWGHQVLEEKVWKYVVPRVAETFADPRERWVFEMVQERVRGPFEVLEGRRPEFLRELSEELGWVERALDGRDYVLGAPSLADCGIYGGLSPLRLVGESVPAKFGRLSDWVARMEALRARGPAGRSVASEPPRSAG